MANSRKIELLQETDLLSCFDESTLSKLVEHCREISLAPKEVLFNEDDLENAMYLILEGELEVFKGPKQIAILGPGQYLEEMSLIESKARSASARAQQTTLLIEINEEHFHTYLASEPQALLSIMRTLSSRIRNDLETMMKDLRQLSIFTHDIRNFLSTLGLAELTIEDSIEMFEGINSSHKKRDGLEDMEQCQHVVETVRTNLMELLDSSLNHVKKIKTIHSTSHRRNYSGAYHAPTIAQQNHQHPSRRGFPRCGFLSFGHPTCPAKPDHQRRLRYRKRRPGGCPGHSKQRAPKGQRNK